MSKYLGKEVVLIRLLKSGSGSDSDSVQFIIVSKYVRKATTSS